MLKNMKIYKEIRGFLISLPIYQAVFLLLLLLCVPQYQKLNNYITITRQGGKLEQNNMSPLSVKLSEYDMPYCLGNLLNRRQHFGRKWKIDSLDYTHLNKKTVVMPCKLRTYVTEDAVKCFEHLHFQHHFTMKSSDNNPKLHLVFMGDSRIRQHFLNFLKLIPDYDQRSQPSPIPFAFHGDIDVTSNILGLKVSFKWQPLVDDKAEETIMKFFISDQVKHPYLFILSMSVWHMLREHGADYILYTNRIRNTANILGKLANYSKVVWLNQYPTVETYGSRDAHNTVVHSEKIHQFNEVVRCILRNQSGVLIWDSSNVFAEEYVRGCGIFHRSEFTDKEFMDYTTAYVNCKDFIHTGYSALSQSTQLLFNDICNAHL